MNAHTLIKLVIPKVLLDLNLADHLSWSPTVGRSLRVQPLTLAENPKVQHARKTAMPSFPHIVHSIVKLLSPTGSVSQNSAGRPVLELQPLRSRLLEGMWLSPVPLVHLSCFCLIHRHAFLSEE